MKAPIALLSPILIAATPLKASTVVFQTGFQYETPPTVGTDAANLNGATGQVGTWSGTVPDGSMTFPATLYAAGALRFDTSTGGTGVSHSYRATTTAVAPLTGSTVAFDFAFHRTQFNNNAKDFQLIGFDASNNQIFNITASAQADAGASGGTIDNDRRWFATTNGTTALFAAPNVQDLPGASDSFNDILQQGNLGTMTLTLEAAGYTMNWMRNKTVGEGGGVIDWTTDAIAYNSVAPGALSYITFNQNAVATAAGHAIDNVVITSIPEPAAALLGSLGCLALLRRRR